MNIDNTYTKLGPFAMAEKLLNDPLDLFQNWLELAKKNEPNDPEAMALATCSKEGKPSVRMVLLKEANTKGFKFHSNEESQKGIEIASNPWAELCFYWKSLRKQIRISGYIEVIKGEEADFYFEKRPYARKIGAWASQQSRPLESRNFLENKINEYTSKFPEKSDIPRPSYWVGYRLVPEKYEFWWDNPDRLHDRFIYEKNTNQNWITTRLYP